MRYVLSYEPADGGARIAEALTGRDRAFTRACALIATNVYRRFEIRDQVENHVIDEPLIRRHCQGDLGNAERSA